MTIYWGKIFTNIKFYSAACVFKLKWQSEYNQLMYNL
jgi:hypothetical protein